jgi:hypothetical protein
MEVNAGPTDIKMGDISLGVLANGEEGWEEDSRR